MDEPKPTLAPAGSTPSTPVTPPAKDNSAPGGWRPVIGRVISLLEIAGAIVLTLWVWTITQHHPRTTDATVRANVVGIAPRVRGQIIKLNIVDNQAVNPGDVLFEIDPKDYELSLAKAKSALATLDQQIEVARSQDAELRFRVKAAEAGVERAKAELKQAGDTLARLQPLLTNGFARAEDVDRASTAKQVATAALAAEEQRLNQATAALSSLAVLIAERPGAVAAVDQAALDLSYCKVVAPFPGRIINLNISPGAYASAGIPVFSMLDTRKWYVMANFREGQIPYLAPGADVDVYLVAAPDRHFAGKVQGIGWAVDPSGEADVPHGVPYIKREL